MKFTYPEIARQEVRVISRRLRENADTWPEWSEKDRQCITTYRELAAALEEMVEEEVAA